CIIVSEGGLVACLGVKDLIVVRTPDAVLVCHRDAAQDIKTIVKTLKDHPALRKFL
ncbi:MAG: mannose-1-phosphate guanylyltransferase/mannose-6-phosphate isomerase, partial [Candidatus Aureabacteria bacterium]|nr:mannose-1-phosphate guanylyltransferase/mannose-6-phosphate isomerase [Candidatus Auribacterota bacterium]